MFGTYLGKTHQQDKRLSNLQPAFLVKSKNTHRKVQTSLSLIVETLIRRFLLWVFITPVFLPEPEPGGGNGSICFFQHVSPWGGGRSRERASPGEHRAFTEFRFCVPTADTAELTHKLMRAGGKKFPIQPLRAWASFSLYYSPTLILSHSSHPQPNDGLCPSSPPV